LGTLSPVELRRAGVAERISDELQVKLGEQVAFKSVLATKVMKKR